MPLDLYSFAAFQYGRGVAHRSLQIAFCALTDPRSLANPDQAISKYLHITENESLP